MQAQFTEKLARKFPGYRNPSALFAPSQSHAALQQAPGSAAEPTPRQQENQAPELQQHASGDRGGPSGKPAPAVPSANAPQGAARSTAPAEQQGAAQPMAVDATHPALYEPKRTTGDAQDSEVLQAIGHH